MDAIWIGAALAVAVLGGWPVTAGLLKFAKSNAVRAVDAADLGPTASAQVPEDTPSNIPGANGGDQREVVGQTGEDARNDQPPAGPPTDAPTPRANVEVLRGGLLIGFLERAAVAVAIFSGQPVAIAYVVAIKGLGRYPELKDTPAASERFIIGTLASMLWAASVAVLTKTLLPIG
ncbi:hypothetical protein [Arthrobacter polaris]|uniref:hypothetical protein n=1 Tax=Arthrobacter polaris TaxID=2813727 RepID=UPI001F3EEFBB|nr:hypothetical protein [Arthrobacter polaris]UIK89524.1 hypothetical protein J0916_03590 [Arthrobacter polaris]